MSYSKFEPTSLLIELTFMVIVNICKLYSFVSEFEGRDNLSLESSKMGDKFRKVNVNFSTRLEESGRRVKGKSSN